MTIPWTYADHTAAIVPALDRSGFAAAVLFTAPSTDRALTGWRPALPFHPDRDTLRAWCRNAPGF